MIVLVYSFPEMNEIYRMMSDAPTMSVPLRTDEHGAFCRCESHILLELVIHADYMGEIPEGIVDSYPSLTTADCCGCAG